LPGRSVLWIGVAFAGICLAPETWDIRFGVRRRWAVAFAIMLFATYFFMNGRSSVYLYYQF